MSTTHNFDVPVAGTLLDTDQYLQSNATTSRSAYATGAQLRSFLSGAIVNTTATTLTVTAASHAGRVVTINSAAAIAVTLPQATGTGNKYEFWIGVAATATSHTIKVSNATDVMAGYSFCVTTSSDNAEGFKTSATSDTITLNGTTLGGVVGDFIQIRDLKTGVFSVMMFAAPTGTEATPFSATVS